MAGRKLGHNRVKVEIAKALIGIDEEIAGVLKALENVNRLEQRHVLDDQRIRHDDRLTQPDFLRIDPTEGDDGSAHALGAKTWEGLSVLILEKRRDGENGRRRDDTLAPTSMYADLEHLRILEQVAAITGRARGAILICRNSNLGRRRPFGPARQINSLILRSFAA